MSNRTVSDVGHTIWPDDADVLVRAIFLNVGQGASTLLMLGSDEGYLTALVDINVAAGEGRVHVPRLLADVLGDEHGLDCFINTHPHLDHLRGLDELGSVVPVRNVWHTGLDPGEDHKEAYEILETLISEVTERGGSIQKLTGSRTPRQLGHATCYVLAPAPHVQDEIDDETADEKYARMHEDCAVLRIGVDGNSVLLPGDADRKAFETYITEYHKSRLQTTVLAAPHHGSRSFFFSGGEDEDPYLDALDAITPEWVVVSAPQRSESEHDHPDPEAMDIYREEVGEGKVLHTGKDGYSFICDFRGDGTCEVWDDEGLLAESFPTQEDKAAKMVARGRAYRAGQRAGTLAVDPSGKVTASAAGPGATRVREHRFYGDRP